MAAQTQRCAEPEVSYTKCGIFFEDRLLKIGRCLNGIEELVGSRDRREKVALTPAPGKQLTTGSKATVGLSRRRTWQNESSPSPRFKDPTSPFLSDSRL